MRGAVVPADPEATMSSHSGQLSLNRQADVLNIWPLLKGRALREIQYLMFLKYVDKVHAELSSQNSPLPRSTLRHIAQLRNHTTVPLTILLDTLRNEVTHEDAQGEWKVPGGQAERLVELLARCWLTLNINISSITIRGIQQTSLAWDRDQTLEGLVTTKFEALKANNEPVSKDDKGRLIQRHFNMAYLHKNYGWAVQWVDNLADHLSIDKKNKIVAIYEHKVCLFNHLMYNSGAPIPRAVLEDAADTLNLLFPREDDTRKFLKDEGRDFLEVGLIARADKRDLGDYHYWRRSLSYLVDVLDMPPTGLRQIALDMEGQNLYQFLTFWLAVIVGVLAVLSIVFGTVATVYAIKQYNLAVAQACSTHGAEITLPQYCA